MLPVEGDGRPSCACRPRAARRRSSLELVERERILVHPGFFFDFPHEAFVVVSLLPAEDVFAEAFERLLRYASA